MQFENDQIDSIMQSIWTSVLGIELSEETAPPREESLDGVYMTSCVHIAGPWSGAFTVACPQELARKCAALMFGMEVDAVSEDETNDALGEIANIAGGNFKALLPNGCLLSLPTVAQGIKHRFVVPSSHVASQRSYRSEGDLLVVKVLERKD